MNKSTKKSEISNRTLNKSSISARSLTPTPKKKQLVVQNHYLNKENNSYQAIMKQKKQENSESYQKLMKSSNIDLKFEKSSIRNNSYIISHIEKNGKIVEKKEIKHKVLNMAQKKNKKLEEIKQTVVYQPKNFLKKEVPAKKSTDLHINLNLKKVDLENFSKKKEESSKENMNLQNIKEFSICLKKKPADASHRQSENEEFLLNNVKNDIENLKNRMKDPFSEKITKDQIEFKTSIFEILMYFFYCLILESEKNLEKIEGNSLKDRINQALMKKNIQQNEEIQLQEVMDLLPDYDPVSYEDGVSDQDDDSD